ncbi:MAG: hypothetical protein QF464_13075 [Myxococcota bacterium]|nr:hypothetical protein [Myxococcota bacterium]
MNARTLVLLCGLLLVAPTAQAGWCKAQAPANACGQCRTDRDCGGMPNSCWAAKSGSCQNAQPRAARAGGSWQALVPAGWSVDDRIMTDFNRDGRQDVALVVKAPFADESHTRADRLFILALGERHGYRQVVTSDCIAQCQWCGGMMGDAYSGMRKNRYPSVIVENSGGSGGGHWTRKFTIAWVKGRFSLIGYDADWTDPHERSNGYTLSVDLLKGKFHRSPRRGLRRHNLRPVDANSCGAIEGIEAAAESL